MNRAVAVFGVAVILGLGLILLLPRITPRRATEETPAARGSAPGTASTKPTTGSASRSPRPSPPGSSDPGTGGTAPQPIPTPGVAPDPHDSHSHSHAAEPVPAHRLRTGSRRRPREAPPGEDPPPDPNDAWFEAHPDVDKPVEAQALLLHFEYSAKEVKLLGAYPKPFDYMSAKITGSILYRILDPAGQTLYEGSFEPPVLCSDTSCTQGPEDYHEMGDVRIPHKTDVYFKIPGLKDSESIQFFRLEESKEIPIGSPLSLP